MKRQTITAIIGLALTGAASAAQVYQCELDGRMTFSDIPCTQEGGGEADLMDYDTRKTGVGGRGVAAANRSLLYGVRARRRGGYERLAGAPLGYSDKTRIRELEMEKRQLREELGRVGDYGVGNYGKSRAIGDQIHDLDRQIEQIRANPSGH